jgi:hypothetical protein
MPYATPILPGGGLGQRRYWNNRVSDAPAQRGPYEEGLHYTPVGGPSIPGVPVDPLAPTQPGSNMGYPALGGNMNMNAAQVPKLPSTTATQAPQTNVTGTPPALDSFTQWFQQLQSGNGWLSGYPAMNQNPLSL